ncbi:MAG: transcriptional repressor [Alphaproteobacteria bacterium]|nr:transcriptional repressor [Alphaproteobacteria bacterium]
METIGPRVKRGREAGTATVKPLGKAAGQSHKKSGFLFHTPHLKEDHYPRDSERAPAVRSATQNPSVLNHLRTHGIRPTRQRQILAKLLFGKGDRHITADALYQESRDLGTGISRATVYNTLHQFTKAGLLREISVASGLSCFDTNLTTHHHFLFEEEGRLQDIPGDKIDFSRFPEAPEGADISSISVTVRLKNR